MTTVYGVTPTGFVLKPTTVLQQEIASDELGLLASDLDVAPDQPLGQLNGIMAKHLNDVWQLAQVACNAFSRGDAEDALLDNIGAIESNPRKGESPSAVYCMVSFSVAGTYAIGALVAFLAPPAPSSVQFANATAIVVPSTVGGSPIGVSNPYTPTPVLFTSTTQGPDFGNALIAANAAASVTVGELNQSVPVAGWIAVADVSGVTLGTLTETDATYRTRQVTDLSKPGACTADAVAAAVQLALQQAPIAIVGATATVYENVNLIPDPVTGLPGKSFMVVVFDGIIPNTVQNDPIIAAAIWKNKPQGMQSYGTTFETTLDSQGNTRIVSYSRPTQLQLYLTMTVAIGAKSSPAAVQIAVVEALVAASQGQPFTMYGQTVTPQAAAPTTLLPGADVVAGALRGVAQGQLGVVDVPSATFYLGFSSSPALTKNLPVGSAQIAVLQSSNITVNVVGFVP